MLDELEYLRQRVKYYES